MSRLELAADRLKTALEALENRASGARDAAGELEKLHTRVAELEAERERLLTQVATLEEEMAGDLHPVVVPHVAKRVLAEDLERDSVQQGLTGLVDRHERPSVSGDLETHIRPGIDRQTMF